MPPAAADNSAAGLKQEPEEPEVDIDLGPGMFNEDAAGMLSVALASKPKTLEDLVGPWGGYGASKKKASKIKSMLTLATRAFQISPLDACISGLADSKELACLSKTDVGPMLASFVMHSSAEIK